MIDLMRVFDSAWTWRRRDMPVAEGARTIFPVDESTAPVPAEYRSLYTSRDIATRPSSC
jgi:hypothetical protein